MNKQRALELLSRSKPGLQARFGVTRLALLSMSDPSRREWRFCLDDMMLPFLQALKNEAQS